MHYVDAEWFEWVIYLVACGWSWNQSIHIRVQVFPKVGSSILPLCNMAVMCWLADSSHIHQCKSESGLGWIHWLYSLRVKWQTRDELCSTCRGGTDRSTRCYKDLAEGFYLTCNNLSEADILWMLNFHSSVFFPGVLREVAVVQGPKLPWYFAFVKTSNTFISVRLAQVHTEREFCLISCF